MRDTTFSITADCAQESFPKCLTDLARGNSSRDGTVFFSPHTSLRTHVFLKEGERRQRRELKNKTVPAETHTTTSLEIFKNGTWKDTKLDSIGRSELHFSPQTPLNASAASLRKRSMLRISSYPFRMPSQCQLRDVQRLTHPSARRSLAMHPPLKLGNSHCPHRQHLSEPPHCPPTTGQQHSGSPHTSP